MEPWEGGTRVVAFLSGGWLPNSLRNTTNDHFIHIADWYVTLSKLVGQDPADDAFQMGGIRPVDGVDVWPLIIGGAAMKGYEEREYLPITEASLIWRGRFKLIRSTESVIAHQTNWYSENGTHLNDDRASWPCRARDAKRHCLLCSAAEPCLFGKCPLPPFSEVSLKPLHF